MLIGFDLYLIDKNISQNIIIMGRVARNILTSIQVYKIWKKLGDK